MNNHFRNKDEIRRVLNGYFKKSPYIKNIYGEFELVEKNIGNGGTADVKGFQLDNQEFAVKFLLEDISQKESKAFKRFKQAYLNLMRVQYSGIILPQIHFDVLDIKGLKIPYIIMRKAEHTLKSLLKNKTISFEVFEKIFYRLLDVIETIHQLDIIHRDIKPENIFVFNKSLVLGDFDIAHFDDNEHIKLVDTDKGERLANYHFSAPEQTKQKDEQITESADWYAFGQVLHWLIVGETLRGQDNLYFSHLDERYGKYEGLIRKLLSENPQERFSSKQQIIDYLNTKKSLSSNEILIKFEDIIFKYTTELGLNGQGVVKYEDVATITEIMEDLQTNVSFMNYWLSQGYSDIDIKEIKKIDLDERCWLIGYREIKIKAIWFFKHYYNLGCSCIILETDNLSPTGVYKTDLSDWEEEEFGLYNTHYIDRKYCDTGWALINGKRVHINDKAEVRIRVLKETLFFIAPYDGPLIRHDTLIHNLYQQYKVTRKLDEKSLKLLEKIKKRSFYE